MYSECTNTRFVQNQDNFGVWFLDNKTMYSERPKSVRPDFGVFENRLVVKLSGFQIDV